MPDQSDLEDFEQYFDEMDMLSETLSRVQQSLFSKGVTDHQGVIGQLLAKVQQDPKFTHYGYKGDPNADTASMKGIGDRQNRLVPGYSTALTQSQREAQFGMQGKSTGQEFQFQGKTFRDDDTAPESDKRVDLFDPSGKWSTAFPRITQIGFGGQSLPDDSPEWMQQHGLGATGIQLPGTSDKNAFKSPTSVDTGMAIKPSPDEPIRGFWDWVATNPVIDL